MTEGQSNLKAQGLQDKLVHFSKVTCSPATICQALCSCSLQFHDDVGNMPSFLFNLPGNFLDPACFKPEDQYLSSTEKNSQPLFSPNKAHLILSALLWASNVYSNLTARAIHCYLYLFPIFLFLDALVWSSTSCYICPLDFSLGFGSFLF